MPSMAAWLGAMAQSTAHASKVHTVEIHGNSNALVYVQTGLEMFFFTVTVASWLQKHLHLHIYGKTHGVDT